MKTLEQSQRQLAALPSLVVALYDAQGEISGAGYSRQDVDMTGPAGDTIESTTAVKFGPAFDAWPEVTKLAICDAVTGDALYIEDLPTPRTLLAGDSITWEAGDIEVSEK